MKIRIVVERAFRNIELGHQSIDEIVEGSKGFVECFDITSRSALEARSSDDDKETESQGD